MTNSQQLKQEYSIPPKGTFAPYYYKYLGYRRALSVPKAIARANAIYSLFTEPGAYIYQSDWIVGSIRPLWCEKSAEELAYARSIVQSFGERKFAQNSDHFAPDYAHTVQAGVPELRREIYESSLTHSADAEALTYLEAMDTTLQGFLHLIERYAAAAKALESVEGYDHKKLALIQENCRTLLAGAPNSFASALQLVWFYHLSFVMEGRYAMALGRIDQYLYPFYKRDIEAGLLTAEFATELLENVFMKIYESQAYLGSDDVVNICIGGTSAEGESQVNDLSYLVLAAVKNGNIAGPNLSARIPANLPDRFLDECLKVIGTGLGYPALMNDSVNLPALKQYGYEEEDVYDYSMVGCIENFITGKQPPWSDGRFDTPRFFEYMFNRGHGICHPSVGLDTGDVSEISSMEAFMEKFEAQLRYGAAEYMTLFHNENTRCNPKEYVQPYLSCFCSDCIGRAKDICDGGSKYPSVHGVALMGVGTVCDSLAAIERVVFCDHAATLSQVGEAIKSNYEGCEELRQRLLAAPKYGNDDPFADKYAVWFVDFLSDVFGRYKTHDGGGIYVAMAANTNNIYAGKIIAATPDGRRSGEPLSDAASPTYGRDVQGATATICSITKPDYTKVACGTVVNQKFSPSMFTDEKRSKLLGLLKTYFKRGGQEMQINATSRDVLIDAMEHPEKYPTMVVRVSGFSAIFVTLGKEIQEDILSRTQQE